MAVITILRKLRAAPFLLYYKWRGRPARDYGGQWNDFWTSVDAEADDQVLWDVADESEIVAALDKLEPHIDRSLPILDLGCGNGRRTRFLAAKFERVIGVDVSPRAIEIAQEANTSDNASYRVLDATDVDAVRALHDEVGPMNIYMRGVFHVIHNRDRPAFISSLQTLLGEAGTVYQLETDGEALDHFLSHPEDSPTGLPKLMHKVVEHGIIPQGFGPRDCERWYEKAGWNVIESGKTVIHTRELGGRPGRVPAFYTIARPPGGA